MRKMSLLRVCLATWSFGVGDALASDSVALRPSIDVDAHAFLDAGHVGFDGQSDVNSSELRLFRIGVSGDYGQFSYVGNVDFGNEDVNVQDAYLTWKGLDAVNLLAGQYKVPTTLGFVSSVYARTLVEPGSVTSAFGSDRRLGVGFVTHNEDLNLQGGAFTTNVNSQSSDEGWAGALRVTYSPDLGLGDDGVVHVGASARYRDAGGGAQLIGYSQRPFTHVTDTKTVNTGALASSDVFYGFEGALLLGAFSLEGEYGQVEAECGVAACANSDPSFAAWHVDASYFLGGARNYSQTGAKFGRQHIFNSVDEGGLGALELVGRYDYVDLSDGLIFGGEQTTIAGGFNYYANKFVRLSVNATKIDSEGGPITQDDIYAATARLQVELY